MSYSYLLITLRCLSTPPHAEDGSVPSGRELMGDHIERLRSLPQRFVTPGCPATRLIITSAPCLTSRS